MSVGCRKYENGLDGSSMAGSGTPPRTGIWASDRAAASQTLSTSEIAAASLARSSRAIILRILMFSTCVDFIPDKPLLVFDQVFHTRLGGKDYALASRCVQFMRNDLL